MVAPLAEGHVEWTMPAPLWSFTGDPQQASSRLQFRTPTILRFANDSFMNEFLNLLTTEPGRLNEFLAAPETWSSPPSEPATPVQKSGMALVLYRARNAAIRRLEARGTRVIGQLATTTSGKVLKLYQPVHGRYYLVTTCLVCRKLGLPDRRIDAGAQETATFVMRLLQPHADADPQNPDPRQCDELALVNGAWQVPADPASLVDGEELRPLSPFSYVEDDQRQRRLLIGLVPVGDRERLLQAVQPNPAGESPLPAAIDVRQMLLKTQIIGPMAVLSDQAKSSGSAANITESFGTAPSTSQRQTNVDKTNDQIQQSSWYLLLDLAKFLQTNLNNVWRVVNGDATSSILATAAERTLWNTFTNTSYKGTSMASALKEAFVAESTLESLKTNYTSADLSSPWPAFRFQFFQAVIGGKLDLTPALDTATLETQIVNALLAAATPSANPPRVSSVAQASVNPQKPVWFTIRCGLSRPNCGALSPALVSEPTAAFQMAAYFDPDAPSRPIRIGLPLDTTPAGLRKFDKNTAFVMSDVLCGQVTKMKGTSFLDLILSVLPFPLHQDLNTGDMAPCSSGGISAGMVCSFSIPIITICALILLIIFVKLLDIIFQWMPFFQICLPLPKLSAKES
jgi:hypothetical protein